ncbi:histidine kinase [Martiniozyma asiatica (nom. inval.)]|nr:histidine kinase [Martiniozyma asiatica]
MQLFNRHRLRISIRTQLITLVLCVALFSLLILAVVCGVYFTTVFTNTRASRLQIAAQLKGSQMEQVFESYRYQVQQLSSMSSIQTALSNRRAGNTSDSVFVTAKSDLEQSLGTTNGLAAARLYDFQLEMVANITGTNTVKNASFNVEERLYIFHSSYQELVSSDISSEGYLEGPLLDDKTYFLSLTMPVYSTQSILVAQQTTIGYLTIIINAEGLLDVATVGDGSDYSSINFFIPSGSDNNSNYTSFYYAFQPPDTENVLNYSYSVDSFAPAKSVFVSHKGSGQFTNLKDPGRKKVSLGYSSVDLKVATWMVTVQQLQSTFIEPTSKLIKIMIGVCFGLAVFMSVMTFPLAHYGVRPIIKLQKATEEITNRRGLRKKKRRKKTRMNIGGLFKGEEKVCDNEKSENELPPNYFSGVLYQNNSSSANTSVRNSWNGSPSTPSLLDSVPESTPDFDGNQTPLPSIVRNKGIFYDELTELSEAFNVMTIELDKQYAHLEDRVRARTKELEAAKVQADTARQQAEAANEAKTVFIANISHELRTPLNGILGMTSVAMTEKDPSKIESSLELIFRSGELLLHILTQLLTFSKNQLDKSKLQKKNFLMIDVASQIQSIFGKTAKDRGVNLVITLKPNFIRQMILFGDSNRIIQVVMNLVSNALKFTPEDGTVQVLIEVLGEYDEDRSKTQNFEKVYLKNLKEDTDAKPVTPIAVKLKKSSTSPISDTTVIGDSCKRDSTISSAEQYDNETFSLMTMESATYHQRLTEFLNDTKLNELYFNEEDDFFEQNSDDPVKYNRKNYHANKFDASKKWVLRMSVSDTGTGIEESLHERIFEAFVQGDQTLSRSHGGTGLGLSICKQFSKMMHGTLDLNSKPGQGSTFSFTIPLPQVGELIIDDSDRESWCKDKFNEKYQHSKKVTFADVVELQKHTISAKSNVDEHTEDKNGMVEPVETYEKPDLITRASTGTASSYVSGSGSSEFVTNADIETVHENASTDTNSSSVNLNFLVAEDNLVNQEVVKRMLQYEGVTDITMARDGTDAVFFVKEAMAKGSNFDLILMDVQMPKLDGLSATKIIRNELHYQGPIVALTAYADESNETTCLDAGMSGFLSKPIRRPLLKKIIKEMCTDSKSKKSEVSSIITSDTKREDE